MSVGNVSELIVSNSAMCRLRIFLQLEVGPILELGSIQAGHVNVVFDLKKVHGLGDGSRFQVGAFPEEGLEIIDKNTFTYEKSSVLAGIVSF
ncbi:hypothetical protein GYMLUDRAFT_246840 [Collybiopsis luxurians FD-317 M1]|uniref:Uncharacterized protein n=1 Tax=Collybiopsis luxurians FD-317 M1 TaxID=944289 RepID=A0A0D0CQ45_9AGAR|nr:hypothetical protein GYMLUDRAFT_246840 [Collybiopsis luxurians FD-317 M1]